MPAEQKPLVLAMMVCDQFYRDQNSGKLSLLGCFNNITSPVFPVRHPGLGVYMAVTDCTGPTAVTVRVVDLDEERPPIATTEVTAMVPDPRGVSEFTFAFRTLTFPAPGEYRIQAFYNKEFLIERRLRVALRGAKPGA